MIFYNFICNYFKFNLKNVEAKKKLKRKNFKKNRKSLPIVHLVPKQLSMNTSKQNYYYRSIKYARYSELINSKKYAHICDDLMELHWLQSRCENSLTYVIVYKEKCNVYDMLTHQ